MKQVLKIEWLAFGSNQYLLRMDKWLEASGLIYSSEDKHKSNRPWVAEIIGQYPSKKLKRLFVEGSVDFSEASKNGDRGVMITFILESGRIYEVKYKITLKRISRYFCTVTDSGEILKINEDEVEQCLNNTSV